MPFRRSPFSRIVNRLFRPARHPIRRGPLLQVEWLEDRITPVNLSLSGTTQTLSPQLQQSYGQLPISFEVNAGQTASQVQYLAQGNGYSLFLTGEGAVLSLTQSSTSSSASETPLSLAQTATTPTTTEGVALAMDLVGANTKAAVSGQDQLPGTSNYFIGNNPSQWHTNVENYGQVQYQNVYPGINLLYHGNQHQLEYDFDVAPGANPGLIKLDFQGQTSISLDFQGDLVLHSALGDVLQDAPVVYQEVNGVQKSVTGKFVLLGENEVGFEIGKYNKSLPLTIDPVLSYSTYLGGNTLTYGQSIAVDSAGNTYVTGYTASTNFPTTSGAFQTSHASDGGNYDVFVTKLNANGTALLYSTYLGGNNIDKGFGIAIDGSGNAYVTGETSSTNFPTTSNAYDRFASNGIEIDTFVTELNANGNSLVYSTYLGGNNDRGNGIAVGSSGIAYVIGTASSNIPVTSGAYQTTHNAGSDAFLLKLNTAISGFSSLIFSTYLGGTNNDLGTAIAVDSSGNTYVTGYTYSSNTFPITPSAFQTSFSGTTAAFVTKLNPTGTSLVYSTYLAGSSFDVGTGITVDGSGDAYITGFTYDSNFPTTPGAFQTSNTGEAAFATKLNTGGTALIYSTYLVGNQGQFAQGIALDGSGNAYLIGYTSSTNFPVTSGAYQTNHDNDSGNYDAFLTKVNSNGTALLYSTYLGGNGDDEGYGIAVDSSDNAYITGQTNSTNFPTTSGVIQPSFVGGTYDAFVTKMSTFAITSAMLQNWTVNRPYNQSITASGGPTPYSFSITSGNLPTGLVLNGSTGAITGTPSTTTGSPFNFTITATDSAGITASQPFTVAINPAPSIASTSLPAGDVNHAYSQTITTNGGTSPISFAVSAGSLPSGLIINSSTGAITGTPTTDVGSPFSFTVAATDAAGAIASRAFTVTINPAPTITTTSLPNWTVNQTYSRSIGVAGGTSTFSFTVTVGNLPTGLSLDSSTGAIAGTPTTTSGSPFNFAITATDSVGGTTSQGYTVAINPYPTITTTNLPNWTVNQTYSQTIGTIGGTAPISFAVTSGAMPTGLSLNPNTGAITGTPTTSSGSPYLLTVTATDAAGATASQAYTVTINSPLGISPTGLPPGTATMAYSKTITVSGGTTPYSTFSVTNFNGGSTGLTSSDIAANASGGTITITGTPTAAGSASFTANVVDSAGAQLTQNYSITVNPNSTTTTLTNNGPNPSLDGQSVSFAVAVSPAVPNGETVSLEDASNGNAIIGTGTLSNGSATITVSSLAVGVHNLIAVYGGDGSYGNSQSTLAPQTVLQLWDQFNDNAQHTGISSVAAQPMDQILWQTSINLQGSSFWHTGEPVFTPNDTVIVPVKVTSSGQQTGTANYELEAFNGSTGALMWTVTSDYISPSNGWLPPYQPVYDPVTNRVYFAGLGGTLEYISNPDNPGSSTPTPTVEAFYGTSNYNANQSSYNSSISIDTPLTVDSAGNIYFGFQETGSNPSGISDGGIARVTSTGSGTYVTATVATGAGSGAPAIGSAPALSNDGSILYVAIADSSGSYLVGVSATTLAHDYSVVLSVPNAGTGVYLEGLSTAAPMVAPDGTVYMGVFANNYDGSRGFMTHYSANLAIEYTPGAFGWDDTPSIIPASMVPSYTGTSSYLILTKYNNYVAAETGSSGGNGVNEIAILDPNATELDPNNDPNPNLLVMKQVLTVTSPTEDSGYVNGGYPDATREWCTNGTAVDPSSDSVFINNEDGYSYRWNLSTDTITQAVEITNGYGEPYTPTAIGPNGVIYALNGGSLFALGGYSNYTFNTVSSLTPAVVGQSVTFTTTLASTSGGAVPTGTITYSYTSGVNDPLNSTPVTLGTVTLVNGQASFTTSSLVPDHYHITATYSGDTTDGYAAGSTTLEQVILANPTVTLSTSASQVLVGQSVTFTATVNPDGIFFVPLGTVSFMDGSTVLGTVALNPLDQSTTPSSSQTATFTTSSLPVGTDPITAVYSGDLNFATSTSNQVTQFVGTSFQFAAASTSAIADPSTVSLTVTRTDGSGNQSVSFYTTDGTAVNGTDYTAQGTAANPIVVNFTGSQTTATISIPTLLVTSPYSGTRSFSVSLENPSSGAFVGSQSSTTVNMTDPPLAVASVTDTPTGFVLQFNRQFNPAPLHLYVSTVPGATLTPASLTLVDGSGNLVYGTLVLDAGDTKATFVATNENSGSSTGAPLATPLTPGANYTLALSSSTSGFESLDGRLLTGTATYTVTPPAADNFTLSVPDFARGPGESVTVPKNNTTSGVPIYIDSGNGTSTVTSLSFALQYNPTILTIASGAATLSAAFASAGFSIASALYNQPGTEAGLSQAIFTISGGSITPAALTQTPVLDLTANVPTGTAFGTKGVLDLLDPIVGTSAGSGPATANDGVDVDAYFGEVSGSGSVITAFDVTSVARVAAQYQQNAAQNEYVGFASSSTGQTSFALVDPGVLANITQHPGAIASIDATEVARAAAGLTISQIGTLPTNGSPVAGGVDPYVYIEPLSAPALTAVGPTNPGSATVGQAITYAVHVNATQALADLDAAGIAIQFDPSLFQLADIATPLQGFQASTNPNFDRTGKLNLLLSTGGDGQPFARGQDLVVATFTVTPTQSASSKVYQQALHLLANNGAFQTTIDSNGSKALIIPAPSNTVANPKIDGTIEVLRPNPKTTSIGRLYLMSDTVVPGSTTGVGSSTSENAEHQATVELGSRGLMELIPSTKPQLGTDAPTLLPPTTDKSARDIGVEEE